MNTTTPDVVNTPASDAPRPRRFSIGRLVGSSLQAVGRFLQLLVMWPLEVATLLLVCVTFSSMALGVGVLLVPVAVGVLRWVATLKRRRVGGEPGRVALPAPIAAETRLQGHDRQDVGSAEGPQHLA